METPDLSITLVDDDILCGRGRGLESFPGNKVFRRIIKEHASFYVDPKTSRSAKSRLVQRIAARLSAENMRFLKKLKGGWRQLEEYDARLKVSEDLQYPRRLCLKSLSHVYASLRLDMLFVMLA